MSIDYIVASLPALVFGERAPMSRDCFLSACGRHARRVREAVSGGAWADLETQLRNAAAAARGGEGFLRPASGCSLFWRERVAACFAEKDVAKRDEMLDRVWWDAAGELTSPSDPLGFGALATYAIRLGIAAKRSGISAGKGEEAFEKLVSGVKVKET